MWGDQDEFSARGDLLICSNPIRFSSGLPILGVSELLGPDHRHLYKLGQSRPRASCPRNAVWLIDLGAAGRGAREALPSTWPASFSSCSRSTSDLTVSLQSQPRKPSSTVCLPHVDRSKRRLLKVPSSERVNTVRRTHPAYANSALTPVYNTPARVIPSPRVLLRRRMLVTRRVNNVINSATNM